MSITLTALQKQRTDTAANWTSANPTLLSGELGFESDTGKMKLGNGSTAWNSLAYLILIPSSGVYPGTQLLMPLGSASAPSLSFSGDANTGLYSPGADQVALTTGGTGRLFINSSGQVGIGTSSPGTKAHIYDSSNVGLKVESGGANYTEFNLTNTSASYTIGIRPDVSNALVIRDANATANRIAIDTSGRVGIGTQSPSGVLHTKASTNQLIGEDSATGNIFALQNTGGEATLNSYLSTTGRMPIVFKQYTSECARIDSSGRLLVGTSSALSTASTIETAGNSNTNSGQISISRFQNSSGSVPILALYKSRGASIGTNTIVANGDELGAFRALGADGTNYILAAEISVQCDGTPGTNDMPGRIVFSTTADGASSPTERMRITNGGNLYVNRTDKVSANVISSFQFAGNGGQYGLNLHNASLIAGDQWLEFTSGTSTVRGSVDWSGSAVRYNTSSDYRLKENVTSISNAAERIKLLKPSRFNFIEFPNQTVDGFIAHEAQAVVPECVTGEKDAVDDEGNPIYQGIDQSKLVPLLTAALQEALAKIETLEARLTAAGI